jgi:glycosyltransferase involved in cell wall biosynthesis
MGLAPARIHVVPNGIDLASFLKLEATTAQLVEKLDLQSAAPLLLLPVRITPRKNIELALRVIAELRAEQNPPPELRQPRMVVTGPLGPHNPANGAYFEQLLALRQQLGLAHAVVFLAEQISTYLPDPIIADFFRLADALFLPSREEGFGIPMLEAAFSRRPVFCTDIPPLRELGGPDAAYFHPDADPAQVAALIRQNLSANPAYRFAARARATFTWEQIYAKHLEPLLMEIGT